VKFSLLSLIQERKKWLFKEKRREIHPIKKKRGGKERKLHLRSTRGGTSRKKEGENILSP